MTHRQQKSFPLEPGPAHALTILTADPLGCSWPSFFGHFYPFDLQPVKQHQMHSSLTPLYRDIIPLIKEYLFFQIL